MGKSKKFVPDFPRQKQKKKKWQPYIHDTEPVYTLAEIDRDEYDAENNRYAHLFEF
jgi:hypothetical protein